MYKETIGNASVWLFYAVGSLTKVADSADSTVQLTNSSILKQLGQTVGMSALSLVMSVACGS